MANLIKCPHCGRNFEITEALKHEIEVESKRKIEKAIREELENQQELEVRDLKKQIAEKDQKVDEMRENELKLREATRKLEEKGKEMDLEMKRKLDEERKKIEEITLRKAQEEHRFKDQEKEKIITDLKNALDDARRKAQQGSQQLQGEILELDIEEALRDSFPTDGIEPVEKGIKGADIRQIVKSPKGFNCGVILWETKRTKAWSDSWITKLKSDLRAEKANIPVIISVVLPDEAKEGFGLKDGVWVVGFNLVIPLASLLRKNLLDIGFQKAVSAHKGDKKDYLYEYITSHEYRQQVESIIEVYKEMQEEIQKERIVFEKVWKKREGQAQRIITSTANVVGSIQGKVGSSALQIKGLDIMELESGEKKELSVI